MSGRKAAFLGTSLAFVAILIVITVIVNFIVGRLPPSAARFDLTQNKEYTLSAATKKIFGGLKDILTVTYYVSKELPSSVATLRQETVDFLNEIKLLAPSGKVKIAILDPEDEANRIGQEREEAKKKKKEIAGAEGKQLDDENDEVPDFDPFTGGISKRKRTEYEKVLDEFRQQGIRLIGEQVVARDKVQFQRFYSALQLSYRGKQSETIADHRSLDNLEYDMASRVLKLTLAEDEKPVIAFFDGQPKKEPPRPNPNMPFPPEPQEGDEYRVLKQQALEQIFKVEETKLSKDSGIPEKARVLIVAQPKDLSDRQVYEINRFVSSGGKAIFLAGKYTVDLKMMGRVMSYFTGLEKLFTEWGVRFDGRPLNSEQCGIIVTQQRRRIGPFEGIMPQAASVPVHALSLPREFDRNSALLQGIPALVFPWSVALTIDPPATLAPKSLEVKVLATSAAESWFGDPNPMNVKQLMANGPDFESRRDDFTAWAGSQNLVAMVSGKFPFIYEGKDVPEWPAEEKDDEAKDKDKDKKKEEEKKEPPQKAALGEAKDSFVLIVGSPDFCKDEYLQYDQRMYSGPFIFVRNAVEAFSLGEDLINIRAKQSSRRPLDATLSSTTKSVLKWVNVLGVPLLVGILGILYAAFRSRASAAFEHRPAPEARSRDSSHPA